MDDRVLGGLLGVHAGDSLGATHEFRLWPDIVAGRPPGWRLRDIVGGGAFGWAPGAATDDTDLTLAVLDAYLDPGGFDLDVAARNMLAWLHRGPKDVGGATKNGLRNFERTGDPRRAGAGPGSAGNGSLMRCLPTGLARGDQARRVLESREISAVTHDDPVCTWSCAAYNEMAAALVDGAAPEAAVDAGVAVVAAQAPAEVAKVITGKVGEGRQLSVVDAADHRGNPYEGSGFVLHSLALAVAAVLDPRPLEEVLVDVVHLGGDTDTNGAIAGGLLGVRDGAAAVPARWVDTLQYADRLREAAPRLVAMRTA